MARENACEVFTAFGEKGTKAESVADKVIKEVRRYITSDVPVEEHLSDQLLLPMALAGKGEYVTTTPSRHTLTNIDVIQKISSYIERIGHVGASLCGSISN